MKKWIKTFLLTIILLTSTLCAFLAPLTADGTAVKAADSSIVETKINVLSLDKQGETNIFAFTTEKDLNIKSVTIEYAYYNDLGTKVSQLKNNYTAVSKTKSCFYSIDLNDLKDDFGNKITPVALKLWKIEYQKTSSYKPSHKTEGIITWKASNNPSGFAGVVRIKTLSVTSDKLIKSKQGSCSVFLNEDLVAVSRIWSIIDKTLMPDCKNAYFFHFNLDNEEQGIEMDNLYRVNINYTTFTQKKILGGLGGIAEWETSYKTHNKDVFNVEYEEVHKGIVHDKEYALARSNLEGYDWQALVEIVDGKESYVFGAYSTETFVEDVAIINLTYVVDGEFIDAEVLDFPTGQIKFEVGTLEKFFNWLEQIGGKYLKYGVIGLLVILILLAISLLTGVFKFVWMAVKILFKIIIFPFNLLGWLFMPTSKEERKFEKNMKKYESKRRE